MQKKQAAVRDVSNLSGSPYGMIGPGKMMNAQQINNNNFNGTLSKEQTDHLSGVNESIKDNESVGLESSFRFKGRGSDFQSPGHDQKNQKLMQSFGGGYYKHEKPPQGVIPPT